MAEDFSPPDDPVAYNRMIADLAASQKPAKEDKGTNVTGIFKDVARALMGGALGFSASDPTNPRANFAAAQLADMQNRRASAKQAKEANDYFRQLGWTTEGQTVPPYLILPFAKAHMTPDKPVRVGPHTYLQGGVEHNVEGATPSSKPLIPHAGAKSMWIEGQGWVPIPPEAQTPFAPRQPPREPQAKMPTGPGGQAAIAKAFSKYGRMPTAEEAWGEYQRLPTNSTQTMIEAAPHVVNLINSVRRDLDQISPEEMGPVMGRWNDVLTGKVGAENPKFKALQTDAELLSTLVMRMHMGARGGTQFREEFRKLFWAGQSPANLRAALDRVEEYANDISAGNQKDPAIPIPQGLASGRVLVRRKSDQKEGTIPQDEFDEKLYERIQ